MPSLRTEGMDALIAQMNADYAKASQRFDRMLLAGAEEVKKGWQQAARRHDLIDTGSMIDSIGYSSKIKKSGDLKYVEIYPQGKRPSGTRQAEVAYVQHWGTSGTADLRGAKRRQEEKHRSQPGIPRTLWVDLAEDIAAPLSLQAMFKIWNEE